MTGPTTEELFRADHYLKACEATVIAAGETGIALDRTVFYVTGGGQPGDTGNLTLAGGRLLRIADTRKDKTTGAILHIPEPGQDLPKPGETVAAEIDWARRYRHMRAHTALHLLCAAIPFPVTGGQVGEAKGRLDFDADGAIEKDAVEAKVNGLVKGDHAVGVRWISDEEMMARPELIRTMSVKPPMGMGKVRLLEIEGVDLQPCGGTHVAHLAEIGPVTITKIENKGARNRRVSIVLSDAG